MHTKNINVNHSHVKNCEQYNISPTEHSSTRMDQQALTFTHETPEAIAASYVVTYDTNAGLSVYKPVFRRPLPMYRMPPAPVEQPPAALPGATPAHSINHHYPIEREVIVSCVNKNPKIPLINERRTAGKLGVAVAPDAPLKHLAAWTLSGVENQQHLSQPGPSNEINYRVQNRDQEYVSYVQNNSPLNQRNYKELITPKPPIPVKTFITYGTREQNVDNSPTITNAVVVEQSKDTPKSAKSKTYTTLKDMISRFKGKDSNESEKNNDTLDTNLNNVNERITEDAMNVSNGQKASYKRSSPQCRVQDQPHIVSSAYQRTQIQIMHQQELINQYNMMRNQQVMSADSLYLTQGFSRPTSSYDMQQQYRPGHHVMNYSQQNELSKQQQDMYNQQQKEREMVIARSLTEGRRAASQPHLLEEASQQQDNIQFKHYGNSRRNSHGNILNTIHNGDKRQTSEEKESDDGGFRERLRGQDRISIERSKAAAKQSSRPNSRSSDRLSQTSNEGVTTKIERIDLDSYSNRRVTPSPLEDLRHPQSKIEDLKEKKSSGSGASSDYDKSGGNVSSNVDSGRGSVAYSSGRKPNIETLSASQDCETASTSKANGLEEPEWVDIVESELRQILEPKFSNMKVSDHNESGRVSKSSRSSTSVTPPLPPLSPNGSDSTPKRERRYKHQSLPADSRPDYEHKLATRSPHKQKYTKRDMSTHYKKQLFGLDTADMTSTTTRSLDLSSLLGGNSDSDISTQDARAIRRQLQGLENMYCEVLKLLGVRKPATQMIDHRLSSSKRRYGSMSSLPSSSVSNRPIVREKRRVATEHRKKNDIKSIKKRFERLESHVVTLARSVAHLSGEMRAQHTLLRELDALQAEMAALKAMYRAQQSSRRSHNNRLSTDPKAFSNPERVKRLTKFFGDEPPLMRLFLKKLGYEKYADLLESEKVGAAELPYVGEERLRILGVPLGPRLRILKEAGAHLDSIPEATSSNTTLAIV